MRKFIITFTVPERTPKGLVREAIGAILVQPEDIVGHDITVREVKNARAKKGKGNQKGSVRKNGTKRQAATSK
jgi:hypothetical protein